MALSFWCDLFPTFEKLCLIGLTILGFTFSKEIVEIRLQLISCPQISVFVISSDEVLRRYFFIMQLQLGYILYHHSFFLIVAYLFSRYMFTLFSLPTQCQSLRKARWNLTCQPSTLQQRYQSPNSRTMAIIFWQFWCLTLPENQRYRSGFRDVWRDFDCSGVGEAGDEAERQDISTTTSRRIISITLDRWLNKLLFWRFGSEKRWKIRATESVEGVKSWSLRSEGRMRRRYRSGASHPGKDLILLHNIAI